MSHPLAAAQVADAVLLECDENRVRRKCRRGSISGLSEKTAAVGKLSAECDDHQIGGMLLPLQGPLRFKRAVLLQQPPSQPDQTRRWRYRQNQIESQQTSRRGNRFEKPHLWPPIRYRSSSTRVRN